MMCVNIPVLFIQDIALNPVEIRAASGLAFIHVLRMLGLFMVAVLAVAALNTDYTRFCGSSHWWLWSDTSVITDPNGNYFR